MTDAVEKGSGLVGILVAGTVLRGDARLVLELPPIEAIVRMRPLTEAERTYATDAHFVSGGGPSSRSAIVLRFWTIAARWNSSRAPESPLSAGAQNRDGS